MPTYSVVLVNAAFNPMPDDPGWVRGLFQYVLQIDGKPMTELLVIVEAQGQPYSQLLSTAQTQLKAQLSGWTTAIGA